MCVRGVLRRCLSSHHRAAEFSGKQVFLSRVLFPHPYSYAIMCELHSVYAAQIIGPIVSVKETTGHSDSWS